MKFGSLIKKRGLALCLCLLMVLTMWAPARAASGTDYTSVLKVTLAKLREVAVNPTSGSSCGEWAVLALARGGVVDDAWYGKYLENLFCIVDECNGVLHSKKYTEYSRVIIGLSAIGQDASKFNTGKKVYDLVSPLFKKQSNGEYQASWQGNNGTIFALIALNTQDYFNDAAGLQARADLLDALLNEQLSSGAWEIVPGDRSPSIDITAMALQALAPYYLNQTKYEALSASHTYAQLNSSVDSALAYLKTQKANDYGSVEAAAQVVVALAALDRDAADDVLLGDVLHSVLVCYDGNGAFYHDNKGGVASNSQMSHEQAAYALVAYDRWKNGRAALYDMTDRGITSKISIETPGSVTVKQTASGTLSVTSSVPCVAVVQNEDGSYSRLASEGSGNTRTIHTVHGSVTIMVLGDVNGDGKLDGSDVIRAKAAYLGKATLDPLHWLVADVNQDQKLDGSDIIRAKAAYLRKANLEW